jgi:hypothetical protein
MIIAHTFFGKPVNNNTVSKDEVTTLNTDFHRFMDLVIAQLDRRSNQIRRLQPGPAKSPPSG